MINNIFKNLSVVVLISILGINGFSQTRIIHIYVALCDNESQGIVPVPKKIGNGNDPDNNLYWGCGYGVRTFFNNSAEWKVVYKKRDMNATIIERYVYKHKTQDAWLVADAYRGSKIKECTEEFFKAAAGDYTDTVTVKYNGTSQLINIGKASLVCYIGHDGLMDFTIDNYTAQKGTTKNDVMILACISKSYFSDGVKKAGATPLLWTTGLMCPEAYTIKAAIDGWLLKETGQQIRKRAAEAYNQYQKCGMKGAMGLFATGL